MFSKFKPSLRVGRVTELTPDRLREQGITNLLLDVDSTLKPYRSREVGPEVRAWLTTMRESGIGLCLLSNGRGKRIAHIAEILSIPYVAMAMKPSPKGCHRAIREQGFDPSRTAMVGDQIFADILAGNRAGLTTILVRPIRPEQEPWYTRLKRPFEKIVQKLFP